MFIFIDESGNLTGTNGEYFIVGSYTVGNPKRITNAFRRWQRCKFPKKLQKQAEVKFNNTTLTDDQRLRTVRYLARQDVRIHYTFLKRRNIPESYRKKGKIHKTGLLYTEIIASTLDLYLPSSDKQFRVFRDKLMLKGVKTAEFNRILERHVLPKIPSNAIFQVDAVDSTTNPTVQVADWISGALARYHEQKDLGKEFYEELKHNIVKSAELFETYWEDKWIKKGAVLLMGEFPKLKSNRRLGNI